MARVTVNETSLMNIADAIREKSNSSQTYKPDEMAEAIRRIAGGDDGLPIGVIVAYGNETPPSNWLVCDGSAVSRTQYADLFAVIGTRYGAGDGSTTFNLPDKRGRVSVGLDTGDSEFNTVGKKGGEKKHTLTINEIPSHNHGVYGALTGETKVITNTGNDWGVSTTTSWSTPTTSTGGGQAHNNLQPYEVDNWIIKVFENEDGSVPIGTRYIYTLTHLSNLTVGSWVKMANDYTTPVIPKGKYLINYYGSITGNSGIVTLNPSLDSGRLDIHTRQTVSMLNDLISSGQSTVYAEFETDSTHTVNLYAYSSITFSAYNVKVEFIKIG